MVKCKNPDGVLYRDTKISKLTEIRIKIGMFHSKSVDNFNFIANKMLTINEDNLFYCFLSIKTSKNQLVAPIFIVIALFMLNLIKIL